MLVAVPGLGLSVEVPARTLRLLEPAVDCVAIALPGFGVPPVRGRTFGPAALAEQLLERLADIGAAPAILMGHSASCQIVAEAASRAPNRVAGLVLVGPTCDPRATDWPRLLGRWARTAAWERPGQVPLLIRDYRHTGPVAMARSMNVARTHRIDQPLARTQGPALIVRGCHDRIAPADWVDALATIVPGGVAATLAAGAHMVPVSHPALLAACVRTFLRKLT
jgi:pimeloyl-ACP methyl ester carboxylesterase